MAAERIIGVDFGTSTSVIRIKRYENGKPVGEKLETKDVVFGGNGAMVPTLIMKKDDDASVCYFGYEAQQKKKKFTNFHSFKMDLESSDPARRGQARLLTEEFYGYLARQYKSQSDGGHLGNSDDKERTIISYPVKWSEETKNFMLETAKKVGFPNVTGMDEAQAAIRAVTVMSTDHLQKHGFLKNGAAANLLLIDMGAGTTDLVLARYTPGEKGKTEVLNIWPKSGGIQFGGREIDTLLQNFFRSLLDEDDAQMIFRRIGSDKFKSWKEETVSPALRKKDTVSDFEVFDSCVEMMGIDLDAYCLDRAAFEKCLADYLKQFPELVNGCLENVGMTGSDVDLVIVTGGHSQWYFVNEMLLGNMPQFGSLDLPKIRENPARIIPITRPQETVALGLAYSGISESAEVVTVVKPAKPPVAESPVVKPPVVEAFRMDRDPAHKAAHISGRGTVIIGTVVAGEIKTGDSVFLCGGPGQSPVAQVNAIARYKETQNTECARKGDYIAVLLHGITEEEANRAGYLASKPADYIVEPVSGEENPEFEKMRAQAERIRQEQLIQAQRKRMNQERWNQDLQAGQRKLQELQEKLKTAGTTTYRIPEGKSIAGAAERLKVFFQSKKYEAQYMQEEGCFLVQARNKPSTMGALMGSSKSVDITMFPVEDKQVCIKVSGGKWIDKGIGLAASSFISVICPIPLIMFGANAVLQGKLIEDANALLKKYFEG